METVSTVNPQATSFESSSYFSLNNCLHICIYGNSYYFKNANRVLEL